VLPQAVRVRRTGALRAAGSKIPTLSRGAIPQTIIDARDGTRPSPAARALTRTYSLAESLCSSAQRLS
jgi:hypothetical protein